MENQRIFTMKFCDVYPLYIQKAARKGHTKTEVDQIIAWLTGYDEKKLQQIVQQEKTFEQFFSEAPAMHPDAYKITGMICGYRIENIENPLMRDIRCLDKLIDELAKGRKMEKILNR